MKKVAFALKKGYNGAAFWIELFMTFCIFFKERPEGRPI